MATATTNLVMRNNTDAEFRAWGSGISAQLAACFGWVKTADSGQIDWLTVLKPALGTTKMGYEIWRFNDALQATAPVFMRIDFGSGANAANPSLWFTFGNGTDGAGAIQAGGLAEFQVTSGADGTSRTAYFSGTTGRGVFATGLNVAAIAAVLVFSVERTKDATGADTADGVLITYNAGTGTAASSWRQVCYQIGVGSQGTENRLGFCMPSLGGGSDGVNITVYPQWIGRGPFLPYGLNLFGYFTDDIVALNTIALTVYGAGHTYLPMGPILGGCVTNATAGKSTLLMRYE